MSAGWAPGSVLESSWVALYGRGAAATRPFGCGFPQEKSQVHALCMKTKLCVRRARRSNKTLVHLHVEIQCRTVRGKDRAWPVLSVGSAVDPRAEIKLTPTLFCPHIVSDKFCLFLVKHDIFVSRAADSSLCGHHKLNLRECVQLGHPQEGTQFVLLSLSKPFRELHQKLHKRLRRVLFLLDGR